MSLVLHAATQQALDNFKKNPAHAVALAGPTGSGKYVIAQQLSRELLDVDDFEAYPYKLVVQSEDGKSISVEAIRSIEHTLSMRVPSDKSVHRIVLIENAHLLTREAQNALLKTLEEPPAGTVLVLTSANSQALLPTVRSRLQHIAVQPPTQDQLQEHYQANGHKSADVARAYSMTGGLPGLMEAILSDQEHPLRTATEIARGLLGETNYERILRVDTLAKDKTLALNTLFILQQMAQVSLRSAEGQAAKRWQTVLETAYAATNSLQQSAQPKLVLTKLMLSL